MLVTCFIVALAATCYYLGAIQNQQVVMAVYVNNGLSLAPLDKTIATKPARVYKVYPQAP